MQAKQLKKYIIEPTLEYLSEIGGRYKKFYTPQAIKLLLMTAAVESNMGRYIVQNNNKMDERKKAVSIYQIEPATIDFIFKRIKRNSSLFNLLIQSGENFTEAMMNSSSLFSLKCMLIYDLRMATIICRLIYWYKTKDPIPNENDNEGLWKYYKKWYNSSLGDTTREEFFKACKRHRVL